MNNHTTISTQELDALRHWAAIGQSAVELAAEALKLDNQEIDHDTVVASLVYSEAVMTAEVKRLRAELEDMVKA